MAGQQWEPKFQNNIQGKEANEKICVLDLKVIASVEPTGDTELTKPDPTDTDLSAVIWGCGRNYSFLFLNSRFTLSKLYFLEKKAFTKIS